MQEHKVEVVNADSELYAAAKAYVDSVNSDESKKLQAKITALTAKKNAALAKLNAVFAVTTPTTIVIDGYCLYRSATGGGIAISKLRELKPEGRKDA